MTKLKGLIVMLLISLSLFGLTACDGEQAKTLSSEQISVEQEKAPTYEQISAEQAKTIMDTEKDFVIIDARTEEEFAEGHIENAILIPEYEISKRAEKELPDKEQLILVYCRSGRRSKIASEELVNLGYTNVKEFGGIINWPSDVVK